jgi:putative Holliday junction resolvase
MRVLGIDYGRKRLGLALSDEGGVLASPLATWNRARALETDLSNITRLAGDRRVGRIVVGLPLNMDGTEGEMAREVHAFVRALAKEARCPVDTFDERLTSSETQRAMIEAGLSRRRRKEERDVLAAVLILQGYLTRSSRTSMPTEPATKRAGD